MATSKDIKLAIDMNDYLAYLGDRRYSPRTVRAYAFDLLHFCRWLSAEGTAIDAVSTDTLLKFLAACRGALLPGQHGGNVVDLRSGRSAGYAPATVNRRMAAVSGLFTFRAMRDPTLPNPVPRGAAARRSTRGERSGMLGHLARPRARSQKKSMASIKDKVRELTRRAKHRTLADLLRRLNPVLRGWCNYFRHGVCKRTFGYVDHFAFWRVVGWLKKRHLGLNMHTLVRRFLPGWEISDDGIEMFRPRAIAIERYRYRGTKIPTPWTSETTGPPAPAA